MSEYIIITTTTDVFESADAIAATLVRDKYAACVQITPVTSHYVWQGETKREAEYLLQIKTLTVLFDECAAAIRAMHTYETPEIIATAIAQGDPHYLAWIDANTR